MCGFCLHEKENLAKLITRIKIILKFFLFEICVAFLSENSYYKLYICLKLKGLVKPPTVSWLENENLLAVTP